MGSNSSRRHHESAALVYADDDLRDLLDRMVEAVCPEDYRDMKAAHDAGCWVGTPLPVGGSNGVSRSPGGCMLGGATLYKLQTSLHRDLKDFWCAIVSSGKREGCEALFPDLGLKLKCVSFFFFQTLLNLILFF